MIKATNLPMMKRTGMFIKKENYNNNSYIKNILYGRGRQGGYTYLW